MESPELGCQRCGSRNPPASKFCNECGERIHAPLAAIRRSRSGPTALVGREAELDSLLAGWDAALRGVGRVISVRGEAGIGKSRLLQELRSKVAPEQIVACRASPLHSNSALYPFVDLLDRELDLQATAPEQRIAVLEAWLARTGPWGDHALPLFGALLALPVDPAEPVFALAPIEQRALTIASLRDWLLRMASRSPLLFMLEDAHWADPTTLEFLDTLVARTPGAAILCVVSVRPEFRPSWSVPEEFDEIDLCELPPVAAEAVVRQIAAQDDLPESVVAEVVARTRGIPLFVEETTRFVLESRRTIAARADGDEGVASLIPTTLQESLMARIDRLGGPKQLLQLASVIGGEFSYEVLRSVAGRDEAVLLAELQQLLDADLVLVRGELPRATLVFKHALIRDAAYESLRRSSGTIDEGERSRLVAETKVALDQLRSRIISKLAKSWQKPDQCVRRRTVLRDDDRCFPQAHSFDEHWYTGPERQRGERVVQIAGPRDRG